MSYYEISIPPPQIVSFHNTSFHYTSLHHAFTLIFLLYLTHTTNTLAGGAAMGSVRGRRATSLRSSALLHVAHRLRAGCVKARSSSQLTAPSLSLSPLRCSRALSHTTQMLAN
jgi:hypothetical protein